jgi:hypothetical protein
MQTERMGDLTVIEQLLACQSAGFGLLPLTLACGGPAALISVYPVPVMFYGIQPNDPAVY